ncbi:porin family protein [Nostoc sp. NIES-2111]
MLKNVTKVALAAALALGFTAAPAQAQLKIGLRLAPAVAFSRVQDYSSQDLGPGNDIKYSGNGAGFGISTGVLFDYFIKPNYAVSSGVYYTVKRAAVDGGAIGSTAWNLQMIQIPITMKLYTNEIMPDMKIYFQLGGALDFVIAQKRKSFVSDSIPAPDSGPFRGFDVSLLLGSGVEYRVAESTTLFAGFSYNRGLLNMMTKYGALNEFNALGIDKANDRYGVRVDMVSLDMGIKF